MEFGSVIRIKSSKLKESIVVYNSVRQPGYVYTFGLVKGNEYRCCRCRELGKYRSVRVTDEKIVGRKNPEDDHHDDCQPLPESAIMAASVDRDMRSEVRSHGKRPREAYNEMLVNVAKKFKSSEEQGAVVAELPSYSDVRVALCRHRKVRCIPVPDPLNIPDTLKVTLRGREVADDDAVKNERFLLHTGNGGRLLVFCADTELTVIHDSEYLVCDGTFEMSPDSAYQLYTVHGFIKGEGNIPVGYNF